jgi:hypothetical protein
MTQHVILQRAELNLLLTTALYFDFFRRFGRITAETGHYVAFPTSYRRPL